MGYLPLSRSNEQSLPVAFTVTNQNQCQKWRKRKILIALRTNLCWTQLPNFNNAIKNVVCFATAELHNSNFFLCTLVNNQPSSFALASISMHSIRWLHCAAHSFCMNSNNIIIICVILCTRLTKYELKTPTKMNSSDFQLRLISFKGKWWQ